MGINMNQSAETFRAQGLEGALVVRSSMFHTPLILYYSMEYIGKCPVFVNRTEKF